jgi:uncharacterized caspase-like protein
MKVLLRLVVLSASLLGLASAEGATWAVVVGIDEYVNPAIPKLRYAVADAKLFAQALKDTLKVAPDHLFLLTSDTVDENSQPRVVNLAYRLGWLKGKVKKDDTLIFYFAGHGITSDGQPYLLTEEADNRSALTLKVSALHGGDVIGSLREAGPANVLVVLDACRNTASSKQEARLDAHMNGGFSHADVGRERSATMFSCSVGERSWEWEQVKHGCYTYYLVEGLRQQAADLQGRITLAALNDFTRREVATLTQKLFSAQSPKMFFGGASATEWVLAQTSPNLAAQSKSADEYVAKLEKLQAQLDREVALRVAAEKRAFAEESRRFELEQRLAVLEKQLGSGFSQPTSSEPHVLAYSSGAVDPKALQSEVARLQNENVALQRRLQELQGNLAKVGLAREVQIQDAQPAGSTLEEALKVRAHLDRQLASLESASTSKLATLPRTAEQAKELDFLTQRQKLQRQATELLVRQDRAAQLAIQEAQLRENLADARIQKLQTRVAELENEVFRVGEQRLSAQQEAQAARRELDEFKSDDESYEHDRFWNADPWRIRGRKHISDKLEIIPKGSEANSFGDQPPPK